MCLKEIKLSRPKGYQLIEKENPDLLINDYKEFMKYIKENELC